jgi:hypothetical protein
VPVHLIGPPELIALFDGWGWTPGMIPDAALPASRMDALRDALLAALATGAPARSAAPGEVRAAQRAVPGPAR